MSIATSLWRFPPVRNLSFKIPGRPCSHPTPQPCDDLTLQVLYRSKQGCRHAVSIIEFLTITALSLTIKIGRPSGELSSNLIPRRCHIQFLASQFFDWFEFCCRENLQLQPPSWQMWARMADRLQRLDGFHRGLTDPDYAPGLSLFQYAVSGVHSQPPMPAAGQVFK